MKRCNDCGEMKPVEEFYKRNKSINNPRWSLATFVAYCKPCVAIRVREGEKRNHARIKRKYNLTIDEYNDMLRAQDYACAICKKEPEALCVDHDKITGEIRGLLCTQCNLGIGFLDHNPEWLRNAAEYVEK
jgi:hypothetical protein